MQGWHSVAVSDALTECQVLPVVAGGVRLLLVRFGDAVYAIAERCSHADQDLTCGIVRYGWIACPAHGARFDLETGEPLNPPASVAIATYPVRVVDGVIEVEVG